MKPETKGTMLYDFTQVKSRTVQSIEKGKWCWLEDKNADVVFNGWVDLQFGKMRKFQRCW